MPLRRFLRPSLSIHLIGDVSEAWNNEASGLYPKRKRLGQHFALTAVKRQMFGGKTCHFHVKADRVVMGTADKNYSCTFGAN